MRATVRVEWDMGHRLPNHDGKCRNLHGHRYAAELTIKGEPQAPTNSPTDGMVADFGHVKSELKRIVDERYDHFTLLHTADPLAATFSQLETTVGVRLVHYVPTAENIAAALLGEIVVELKGVTVAALRLYETPTSYVEVWK